MSKILIQVRTLTIETWVFYGSLWINITYLLLFLDDVGQPPPAHSPILPSRSKSAPVSSKSLAKDDLTKWETTHNYYKYALCVLG